MQSHLWPMWVVLSAFSFRGVGWKSKVEKRSTQHKNWNDLEWILNISQQKHSCTSSGQQNQSKKCFFFTLWWTEIETFHYIKKECKSCNSWENTSLAKISLRNISLALKCFTMLFLSWSLTFSDSRLVLRCWLEPFHWKQFCAVRLYRDRK